MKMTKIWKKDKCEERVSVKLKKDLKINNKMHGETA
jgi:hypothetical protein